MEDILDQFRGFLKEHRSGEDARVFEALVRFIRVTVGEDAAYPYWYPLWELKKETPAAAYDLMRLYRKKRISRLQRVLEFCGIDRALAFQMQMTDGGMRLREVSMPALLLQQDEDGAYDFPWDVETFYFDQSRSWLIYVSHEGSITFGGSSLTQAASALLEPEFLFRG